ncbi:MAG: hypothetical protein JW811_07800 [Clostridiales bacterium]|nr:hypothetical protein [Clostridiales bacterium]
MDSSHLVAKPSVKARTRKRLAPSRIRGPLVLLGRHFFYLYLRYALKFRKIEVLNPETVVQAVGDHQEGRTRLIVAFRHPYGDEPQLLFHVFEKMVPRYARWMQRPLKHSPGVRPVHDYAVALWGDAVIRFILPRVGAVPVYHVKYDRDSVRGIRSVMKDGRSPLGIASEGQISYHAETLPRIEQGTVRMGFWCASDLDKAGRGEHVTVLPLSVHYRYLEKDMRKVVKVLGRIETLCGLDGEAVKKADATPAGLLPRVDRIEDRLLELTEAYYADTYGYQAPENTSRHERWTALQPFALSVAEHALGIDPGRADTVQRMYKVRQSAWDRIYPETSVKGLSPLQAAFADRRSGEAWYAMRHMELVDLMSYHDEAYFSADHPESQTFDRLVESVYTLEDLSHRLMGGNITNRPNTVRKNAVLVAGEMMDLTENLPAYRADARQTVQTLTEKLAGNFEDCIEVYRNGKNEKHR